MSDARSSREGSTAAVAIQAGALPLGGGLLALLRPALARLDPGGVIAVLSSSRAAADDLPSWCRIEGHVYMGATPTPDGGRRILIGRGAGPGNSSMVGPSGSPPRPSDLLAARPFPERADPATGFAPRGSAPEPGGPDYPFTLIERDQVAPPEIAELYERALAAQWDADRDIPWATLRPLPAPLAQAVGQIMSFLAENELAALYVPARFLPRIHPAFAEVAMLLASQLADEARHIDVFLRRAHAAGQGLGVSATGTSLSLRTLLALEDLSEATFVLSVLGEGTFLDLLRFVEEHAPDEATREIARRARADEARHVHFGLGHVRHALAHDPALAGRLEQAVRRRAAVMRGETIPAAVQDALTMLAARDTDPASVARGHEAYRALLETMHGNRLRRLLSLGFAEPTAAAMSALHTPNFM
jgi:TusA-related sulfurtransferase